MRCIRFSTASQERNWHQPEVMVKLEREGLPIVS
jgi:hypothetical protein